MLYLVLALYRSILVVLLVLNMLVCYVSSSKLLLVLLCLLNLIAHSWLPALAVHDISICRRAF